MTREASALLIHTAPAAPTNQPGGLFLLAWGLVASVVGLGLVTNVRGLADNLARQARVTLTGRLKRALWEGHQPRGRDAQARVVRIIGIPFVIVGPVMIVIGIVSISPGRIAMPGVSAQAR